MRALPVSACLLLWAVTLHAQSASNTKAPTLSWGPAPAAFPSGAKMAVVSGDPGKAGPFTVELSFPNGYRIPPHFHPTDEAVEVNDHGDGSVRDDLRASGRRPPDGSSPLATTLRGEVAGWGQIPGRLLAESSLAAAGANVRSTCTTILSYILSAPISFDSPPIA